MTQEEKQLLLKDLCARLSCSVILDNPNPCGGHWDELISIDVSKGTVTLLYDGRTYEVEKIKPYLRPMSSMTEEEMDNLNRYVGGNDRFIFKNGFISSDENFYQGGCVYTDHEDYADIIDWLNKHMFDYRGLIEKGLALEAKEGMYE